MASDETFDAAVVGGGAAGLTAALALARAGFRMALVGPPDPPRDDGRTVALLDGSVRLLDALGAWAALKPAAAPLRVMRLIDDTGSLFRPPPATFDAAEIDLDAFGWNVEHATLLAGLTEAVRAAGVSHRAGLATKMEVEAEAARLALESGDALRTRLVVASDGRRSRLREAAGIAARSWAYPQSALTTRLRHARGHADASTEFHTRHGPFTLVPLPGRRSSLVWVTRPDEAEALAGLDDAALAGRIERQARSMLGAVAVDGPRGLVPMTGLSVDRTTAPRLALIGEAAHVLPPIGAQGLNLGLRDAAALRDALLDARAEGAGLGSARALGLYERSRAADVAPRARAVDALNRSLLADLLPVDFLRGAGLLAVTQVGPLRRALMREGLQPRRGLPRLMARPVIA